MLDPRDFALLNDWLDGRLEPAAADAFRKRLEAEADLAAAWDDLRKIRETLRALPAPAVPAGFSEGVRARASGGASSSSWSSSPAPILGFPRAWLYAAAAVAGLGIGLGVYMASRRGDGVGRSDTTARANGESPVAPVEAPTAVGSPKPAKKAPGEWKEKDGARAQGGAKQPSSRDELDALLAKAEAERVERAKQAADEEGRGGGAGAGAAAPLQPRFTPGGAVPPNLREPSDTPAPPPPLDKTAPPPLPPAPAPAPSGPPSPEIPPAPPVTTPGTSLGRPTAEGRAGPPATAAPVMPPTDAARRRTDPGADESAGASAAPAAKSSPEASRDTGVALRFAASDFDSARAELALLVAHIRRGEAVQAQNHPVDPATDSKIRGKAEEQGAEGRAPAAGKSADSGASAASGASDGDKDAAAPSGSPIGSFVFDLTPEQAERLAAALGAPTYRAAKDRGVDARKSGVGPTAPVRILVVRRP